MTPGALHSRVIRGVEATYDRDVAHHVAAGIDPAEAHVLAFAHAKTLLDAALAELQNRGLSFADDAVTGVQP